MNPLLFWYAHSNHRTLIRQLQYLKVENQILRGKLGGRVVLTPQERQRLIRFSTAVGPAIRHLISIVTSRTWDRWLKGHTWRKGTRPRKPGRPRTPEELELLVLRIARETQWGYTRILGELKKLGIGTVSRTTVVNILKKHGLHSGPKRGPNSWDAFIRRHARTLWACDFLTKRVLTWRGWKDAYLLIFINLRSRRAWVSPSTFHPTRTWSAGQAVAFCQKFAGDVSEPRMVIRDRDCKFLIKFDEALESCGVTPLAMEPESPNLNAYAERFVQTLQVECLDHFVAFGAKHVDHLVREFLEYYHAERPHQSLGNVPLSASATAPARASPTVPRGIICRERLGGLLKHYRWREAA